MILATQRPSGAVNENIRANTNLRICLRVQTPQDSTDVIDSPAAARIPRKQPGRAQIRLGPSELVPVQTALVTAVTSAAAAAAVVLTPFTLVPPAADSRSADADGSGEGRSDLQRLVGAANDAFTTGRPASASVAAAAAGRGRARRSARARAGPRHRRRSRAWSCRSRSPTTPRPRPSTRSAGISAPATCVLYGIGGSGTTTTLSTIALSLAEMYAPGPAAHVRDGLRRRRARRRCSGCRTSER